MTDATELRQRINGTFRGEPLDGKTYSVTNEEVGELLDGNDRLRTALEEIAQTPTNISTNQAYQSIRDIRVKARVALGEMSVTGEDDNTCEACGGSGESRVNDYCQDCGGTGRSD